jgi:nicotinamide mononucleotide adenylyltransferase
MPTVEATAEETPIVEEAPVQEETIAPAAAVQETPAQEAKPETVLQQHLEGTIEDIEAEQIHVQFLERLCKQFDADEINAHVKVVYKKKNEKKTSIFDVLMKRNK